MRTREARTGIGESQYQARAAPEQRRAVAIGTVRAREEDMLRRVFHKIIRRLPAKVRRVILPSLAARLARPLLLARRDVRPGPVTVAGLMTSTVGLGQGARLALKAFEALGYGTRHLDVGEIFYWHKNIEVVLGPEAKPGEGGVLVVHLNPPELLLALPVIGRKMLRDRRIIGVWAWELATLPKTWLPGIDMVDEIWVPSDFVASALAGRTKVPVRVVHHPLSVPVPGEAERLRFGLPEEAFVVLTMFDMRSSAERKNPIAAIRAFRRAFSDRMDVLLVVKIGNPLEALDVMSRIEDAIGGAQNIRLIFEKLSQPDHAGFMACCDAIISLHRSEGFGLVLAEAMLLGKPVIATAYSGNMDFMDETCVALVGYKLIPVSDPQGIYGGDGAVWAEPDVDEAAEWLIRLAGDAPLRERLGARAKMYAEEVFDIKSFKDAIGDCGGLAVRIGGPELPDHGAVSQDTGL